MDGVHHPFGVIVREEGGDEEIARQQGQGVAGQQGNKSTQAANQQGKKSPRQQGKIVCVGVVSGKSLNRLGRGTGVVTVI